jgi:hypothetical protein
MSGRNSSATTQETMMTSKQQVIVPPTIQVMMTGACFAKVRGTRVELHYTDGSIESANLTFAQMANAKDDWFSLVSSVQAHRKE